MSTSLVLSAAYLSLSLSLFLTLPPSAWLRIQDRVKERERSWLGPGFFGKHDSICVQLSKMAARRLLLKCRRCARGRSVCVCVCACGVGVWYSELKLLKYVIALNHAQNKDKRLLGLHGDGAKCECVCLCAWVHRSQIQVLEVFFPQNNITLHCRWQKCWGYNCDSCMDAIQ